MELVMNNDFDLNRQIYRKLVWMFLECTEKNFEEWQDTETRALITFNKFLMFITDNIYYAHFDTTDKIISIFNDDSLICEWSYKDYSDDEEFGDLDMFMWMANDFYNKVNKE